MAKAEDSLKGKIIVGENGYIFGQPIQARLPAEVTGWLTQATSLIKDAESKIQSATDTQAVRHALYQFRQVKSLQKSAIKNAIAFYEVLLSKVLSAYDAHINVVQQDIITDDTLSEETKSSILTRSAHALKKDTHIIAHIKQAIHAFQVKIQHLAVANESAGDAIYTCILDLAHAPIQAEKFPHIKQYAALLVQAETSLATVIKNELEWGHYTIDAAYEGSKEQTMPLTTTSFFHSNFFHVLPPSYTLFEDSQSCIEKAKALAAQYCFTASSLLTNAENILQKQKLAITSLGKSGELHFKDFQSANRTMLGIGIKQLGQLSSSLKNTLPGLLPNAAEAPLAVTALLRVVYALENAATYAIDMQSSHPRNHVLTTQKLETMRQLRNHYKDALFNAEKIITAMVTASPAAHHGIAVRAKQYLSTVSSFFHTLFAKKKNVGLRSV